MKTRIFRGFLAIMVGGVLVWECLQQVDTVSAENSSSTSTVLTSNGPSAVAAVETGNVVPVAKPPANLSPGVVEVLKLVQSGVSEDVMLAFIKNYEQPLSP